MSASLKWLLCLLCHQSALILLLVPQAEAQVGKTFIGLDENDTSTFFSFNENYAGLGGFFIPVYVGLFNETTDEPILDPPSERVEIDCEIIEEPRTGFTDATFDSAVGDTDITNPTAEIGFDDVTPGRPVSIQCWGVSRTPGVSFSKETSLSTPVVFEIRPNPTANILTDMVIVPNSDLPSEFLVQLTEVVEYNNVTVFCGQYGDTMELDIPDVAVLTGEDRAKMEVTVIEQGDGSVVVNCSALSDDSGPQFDGTVGQSALFVLDQAEVMLLPTVTTLTHPEMTAYLILDAEPVSEITYYCNITEVDTLDEAIAIRDSLECDVPDDITPTRAPDVNSTDISTTTTQATGSTVSTTTVSSTNTSSGVWQLSSSTVDFVPDDPRYKSIKIERSNRYQAESPELVVVKCCAPPELNTSPKYNETKAAFLAIAYVSEERSINWTAAVFAEDLEVESEILDPAFVELSPCPCDVTLNKCDVDCCCDGDCSQEDTDVFTCIPGIQGGFGNQKTLKYNCSNEYFKQPDWFPLMCVQFENSYYLGLFRLPINATRSDNEFQALSAPFNEEYSYEDDTKRFDDETPEANDPFYVQGFAVKTGIRPEVDELAVEMDISNYFRLTLPQRTWTGKCVKASPVRYLIDAENDCTQQLTENMCGQFTQLSALIYAQSSAIWQSQASPQVMRENNAENPTISFTNTNYYCLTSEEVADYIAKTITRKEIFTKTQRYYFDETLDNFTACDFNAQTGAYLCDDLVFKNDDATEFNYTRCSWDNGFTQAPFPEFDGTECNNAVVDVLYNFTWKGQEIERLDATVLLGNLSLQSANSEPTVLTQMFQVVWTHKLNETLYEDGSVSSPDSTDVFARSGKPGYEFGLKTFSGVDARNDSTDEFLYIDTNSSKSLSLWNPSESGLCEGAGREDIAFGVNAHSSCMLRLALEDLTNCDDLRKLILLKQDNMMISNYISAGGNPDRMSLERWVEIFREDISSIIDTPISDETTTDANFITSMTSAPEVSTVFEDEVLNETFSYVDTLVGRCPNIPAHIHVDIMYALVGKVNFHPIYEIIGAKVSYALSTWKLYCAGSEGEACTEEALMEIQAQVQTFTVASSVSFIEVPPSIPVAKTDYELRQDLGADYVCTQDSCLEELFYPLTHAGDTRFYALGFGLVSVIYMVGYFIVTKPWW